MKVIILASLTVFAIALAGCNEEKSRDFFAAGGVNVGVPEALGAGSYRIPIEFETEIVHSGQWIDAVDAGVEGTDILVTAIFAKAKGMSRYPGYVEVKGASPGTYTLKYRDPDCTDHVVGPVTLP